MKPSTWTRGLLVAMLLTCLARGAQAQHTTEHPTGASEAGAPVQSPVQPEAADSGLPAMDLDMLAGCVTNFDCMFVDGQVVVTGTRTVRQASEAPVATQVLSRGEIQISGARNAGEILQTLAGIQVKRGSGGEGLRLRIQGIDPRRVLVLVDGQRVTGGYNGEIDLSRFPSEMIERIEILRGAASALYGSDALGGVVNLITRRADAPLQAEASLRYGKSVGSAFDDPMEAGDNWDASLGIGLEAGPVTSYLSGGVQRADAFDLYPSDYETNGSQVSEYRIENRTQLNTAGALEIGARLGYSQRDLLARESTGAGATYDIRRLSETLSAGIDASFELENGSWLQGRIAYFTWNAQYVRDQRYDTAEDVFEHSVEDLAEASLQYNIPLGHSSDLITVGIDGLHQQLDSDRLGDARGERTRISPFAQMEWRPSRVSSLVLVPGVRADLDTQFDYAVSPKLNIRFDPSDSLVLRAGVGQGFRAPNFKELLLRFENPTAGYRVEGNPDLKPEKTWSINLGADWKLFKGIFLEVNLYRNELRDLIGFGETGVDGGTREFTYLNIARAYTQGVESTLTLRAPGGLSAALEYTLTDSLDRDQNRRLGARSPHRAATRIRYQGEGYLPTLSLQAGWSSRAPSYEDLDGEGEEDDLVWIAPLTTIDLRMARTLFEGVEAFLGGDNLTNAGDLAQPLRPRTFYVGLTGNY